MSEEINDVVFLKGERVVLRPTLRSDVPYLIRWINDPEVRKFLTPYMPMHEVEEEQFVQNASESKPNAVHLIIEVDGKPIGTMGIGKINWRDRVGTTGAMIGEKEHWSKGYGSEAKELLLEYIFNTLNLRKVNSSVFAFNKRSRAYMLKCGHHEEGRLKKQCFRNGKYHDEILFAVFKSDWKKRSTFAKATVGKAKKVTKK